MKAIAAQLEKQYPGSNHGQGASVFPLSELIVGHVRPILLTLLSGAGLLLLIACVNVASLLLVRSESRRREIAVRGALGATPLRLMRQFVTEGLLLAAAGSFGGGLVAVWIMSLLKRLVPKVMADAMPFLAGVGMNVHTAIFTAGIALRRGIAHGRHAHCCVCRSSAFAMASATATAVSQVASGGAWARTLSSWNW